MATDPQNVYDLKAPAILFHPNLFRPRQFGQKGRQAPTGNNANNTPKYSAALGMKPGSEDAKAVQEIIVRLIRSSWPGRDLKEFKWCMADGGKLADRAKQMQERANQRGQPAPKDCEYFRGFLVVKARSVFQPRLAGIWNGKPMDFETDAQKQQSEKLFFFGAEVGARLSFAIYNGVGENPDGVNAYLNMVFATGKGDKIGGSGVSCAETFSGYVGKYTAENPMGSSPPAGHPADDQIPF